MTGVVQRESQFDGEFFPLVSVITPVYNGAKYIEELILSVKEQEYPNIEHIIIDDGSTDSGATVAILERYSHLRWWSRPNKGQYPTMNEALAVSRGDLINVICADDKYASPRVVSTVVEAVRRFPDADVFFGDTIRINENGIPLEKQKSKSGLLWLYPYYQTIPHCSIFLLREVVFDKGIWFDETFPHCGDFDWIIRMYQKCGFQHIRSEFSLYRQHPLQKNKEKRDQDRINEENRLFRKHSVNTVIYRLVQQGLRLLEGLNYLREHGAVKFYHRFAEWMRRR
jgi:glycosyltransferase involved in cell wall biosynthesis